MKSSEINLEGITLDRRSGRLTRPDGEDVELRNQSRQVLLKLSETPGEIVSRQAFFDAIWKGTHVSDDSLVQCIAEIRQAIGDTDRRIIQTVPKKGYRLVLEPSAPPPGSSRRNWLLAGAALAVSILAAVAIWSREPDRSGSNRLVVAVLPFDDLGVSDPATSLGDSVSDDIINSLARYSEFDVIARHSSFRFRDAALDLRDVAEQLGADYLVQGGKVVQDRTLRVSVQLIDARDLTNVWVDRFEVPLEDLFDVNDTIAYRIAHEISSSVVAINAAAPREDGQVDALMLDNQARVLFQSAPRRESWIEALAISQQSIERFPDSEWGYIGRALMLRIGVRFGWSSEDAEGLLAEAEELALRAVEFGPQNYMSHLALGRVLMQMGEAERATAALESSAALNPSSTMVLNALGQAYIYSDQLDDVHRVLDRIELIDPVQDHLSIWMRAWAEWQAEECEAALASMQSMPVIPPEARKLEAVIHVCLGNREAASEASGAFLERYPDWTLTQEVETNARNWTSDGPRERWLAALTEVGIPD